MKKTTMIFITMNGVIHGIMNIPYHPMDKPSDDESMVSLSVRICPHLPTITWKTCLLVDYSILFMDYIIYWFIKFYSLLIDEPLYNIIMNYQWFNEL